MTPRRHQSSMIGCWLTAAGMEPWSAGRSVGCLILDGTREKGKKNLQGLCEKTEMIIMIFFSSYLKNVCQVQVGPTGVQARRIEYLAVLTLFITHPLPCAALWLWLQGWWLAGLIGILPPCSRRVSFPKGGWVYRWPHSRLIRKPF